MNFFTESGTYYPMIADKLTELNVFDHIEELLRCAQENVFLCNSLTTLLFSD